MRAIRWLIKIKKFLRKENGGLLEKEKRIQIEGIDGLQKSAR